MLVGPEKIRKLFVRIFNTNLPKKYMVNKSIPTGTFYDYRYFCEKNYWRIIILKIVNIDVVF